MSEIIEINKTISAWLEWDIDDTDTHVKVSRRLLNCGVDSWICYENLKFHTDSNWQWVCLEKIAEIEECDIADVYQHLSIFRKISNKMDMFHAIYGYISNLSKN